MPQSIPIAEESFPVIQKVNSPAVINLLEESFPLSQKEIQKTTKKVEYMLLNPYEKLDEHYKYAVRLRVKFMPYRKIVELIKKKYGREYQEGSIRAWFKRSGRFHDALVYWRSHIEKEEEEEYNQVSTGIRMTAANALGMLAEGLLEDDLSPEQIRIAQDILDRAGFPKIMKTDFTGKIESTELKDIAAAMRNMAEELKK